MCSSHSITVLRVVEISDCSTLSWYTCFLQLYVSMCRTSALVFFFFFFCRAHHVVFIRICCLHLSILMTDNWVCVMRVLFFRSSTWSASSSWMAAGSNPRRLSSSRGKISTPVLSWLPETWSSTPCTPAVRARTCWGWEKTTCPPSLPPLVSATFPKVPHVYLGHGI